MTKAKYKFCRECKYYKKARRKKGRRTFLKVLVSAVVLHGMICVSMSYILAWAEHTQVVEAVSSTIITEIVAPIIVYGFTKTIENIFEKNQLKFSTPIDNENGMVAPVQPESEDEL